MFIDLVTLGHSGLLSDRHAIRVNARHILFIEASYPDKKTLCVLDLPTDDDALPAGLAEMAAQMGISGPFVEMLKKSIKSSKATTLDKPILDYMPIFRDLGWVISKSKGNYEDMDIIINPHHVLLTTELKEEKDNCNYSTLQLTNGDIKTIEMPYEELTTLLPSFMTVT